MKTLKLTPKQIKEGKTKFNKLKAAEKRVSIATDVLKQITSKVIEIQRGDYMCIENYQGFSNDFKAELAQDKIINGDISCTCCAMGAIFASKAILGNNLTVEALKDVGRGSGIVKGLKGIFSEKQLRLIEAAFENGTEDSSVLDWDSEDNTKAMEFYIKYKTDTTRLRGIMKNIIKNNGTFKP